MSLVKKNQPIFVFCMVAVFMIALLCNNVGAQQSETELEWRVQKLEKYVETFQPTISNLSNNLNESIQEYTKGLESSLENYSQKLQTSLDERLSGIDRQVVILNPYSKSYQSIETNTGMFLISVGKVEKLGEGVRVHLNIGNPNYAEYENFQLKLIWGSKWAGDLTTTHEQWRQTLNGAEYSFQGRLEKGKWNTVTVDLNPTGGGQLDYLECEMTVSSVELEFN